MACVPAFKTIEAGLHEVRYQVVDFVQARMSHNRQASSLVNEFDAFQVIDVRFWHPSGGAPAEEPGKSLVNATAETVFHQCSSHMGASWGFAFG